MAYKIKYKALLIDGEPRLRLWFPNKPEVEVIVWSLGGIRKDKEHGFWHLPPLTPDELEALGGQRVTFAPKGLNIFSDLWESISPSVKTYDPDPPRTVPEETLEPHEQTSEEDNEQDEQAPRPAIATQGVRRARLVFFIFVASYILSKLSIGVHSHNGLLALLSAYVLLALIVACSRNGIIIKTILVCVLGFSFSFLPPGEVLNQAHIKEYACPPGYQAEVSYARNFIGPDGLQTQAMVCGGDKGMTYLASIKLPDFLQVSGPWWAKKRAELLFAGYVLVFLEISILVRILQGLMYLTGIRKWSYLSTLPFALSCALLFTVFGSPEHAVSVSTLIWETTGMERLYTPAETTPTGENRTAAASASPDKPATGPAPSVQKKPAPAIKKLWEAAEKGDLNAARAFLKNGADPNERAEEGYTPLCLAALTGRTEIVRLLIENGAIVDKADWIGRTPLMGAALNGHAETLMLLINSGADVNIYVKRRHDNNGPAAIDYAAHKGHADAVRVLIQHGANVNRIFNYIKLRTTTLEHGVHSDDTETLKALLEVDYKQATRDKALLEAIRINNKEMVSLILETGVSSDAIAKAIDTASAYDYVDILKLLLEKQR